MLLGHSSECFSFNGGFMTIKWEDIDPFLQRAKIPGGWLVKAFEDVMRYRSDGGQGMVAGWDWRIAMCFVPDPTHEWK
jgi:hypothetical protein